MVNEARNEVIEFKSEQLLSIIECLDFWYNQLFFLRFGRDFKKHTYLLETIRSTLATHNFACFFQGPAIFTRPPPLLSNVQVKVELPPVHQVALLEPAPPKFIILLIPSLSVLVSLKSLVLPVP